MVKMCLWLITHKWKPREKEDMSAKSQTGGTCLTEVDVEVQTMPSAEVEVVHSVDEKVVAWRMCYVEENVGEGRQCDRSKTLTGNEKVKSGNISRNPEKGEKFFRKRRKSDKVKKDTCSSSQKFVRGSESLGDTIDVLRNKEDVGQGSHAHKGSHAGCRRHQDAVGSFIRRSL